MTRHSSGQAAVEAALALLLLATLTACLSRAGLAALLRGKAESASFQSALRHGRSLPPADAAACRETFGASAEVKTETSTRRAAPLAVPLPVPLAGRSGAVVNASANDGFGAHSPLAGPLLPAGRSESELSCDPWDGRSPTGAGIRKAVRLLVAAGWMQ